MSLNKTIYILPFRIAVDIKLRYVLIPLIPEDKRSKMLGKAIVIVDRQVPGPPKAG